VPNLLNRVKMTVSGTPGTGDVTLGSAETNYQTFANAGAAVGDRLEVVFEDGTAWEISSVTYGSGPSLTDRTLVESSTASLLSLTSAAIVFSDASKRSLRAGQIGRTVALALNMGTP
jgi:hypothetical protein